MSEVAQSCLTLCDPMDCSLPGSSVHGIFQAIVLEWIAISFSRGSSWPRDQTQLSHIVDRRLTIWATMEVPYLYTTTYYIYVSIYVYTCIYIYLFIDCFVAYDFPGGSDSTVSAYNVGDQGPIPGSGRSPGEGSGTPLQYSCLENPMDRGTW